MAYLLNHIAHISAASSEMPNSIDAAGVSCASRDQLAVAAGKGENSVKSPTASWRLDTGKSASIPNGLLPSALKLGWYIESNECDGVGGNVFRVFCISGVSWSCHTEVLPEVLSKFCSTLSAGFRMGIDALLRDPVAYQRLSER
jgi:hypothetical protein